MSGSNIAKQPQEVQEIQDLLQAPLTTGADKLLINVNGKSSKLITNKNAIIKYTMEQPVKLEIGDKVTLINSFVEERGLSLDTISFEDDVEEEMRFLYYIQGNCQNAMNIPVTSINPSKGQDQKFTCFPNIYPDYFDSEYTEDASKKEDVTRTFFSGLDHPSYDKTLARVANLQQPWASSLFPNRNYVGEGNTVDIESQGKVEDRTTGANGQYYYLGEWYSPFKMRAITAQNQGWDYFDPDVDTPNGSFGVQKADKFFWRPVYGSTTIKIPAGNYSVSALSDLINSQFNGSATSDDSFNNNALINKLYRNTTTDNFINNTPYFDGLQNFNQRNAVVNPLTYNPDVAIIGADTEQPFQRRRGDTLCRLNMNGGLKANVVNMRCLRYTGVTNAGSNTYAGEINANTNPALPTYKIDTTIQTPKGLKPSGSEETPANETPDGKGIMPAGMTYIVNRNSDSSLWSINDPISIQARQYNNNCYLHLTGMRDLFESNAFMTEGDGNTSKVPTLADWFLGNIGDQGLYYMNRDLNQRNYGRADEYFWNSAEDLKWQLMFPVTGSGFGVSVDAQDPIIDSFGAKSNVIITSNQNTTQRFAGTSSLELKYDSTATNRFSILNLHEPYKMANATPDGKSDTNFGGQQATLFNNPTWYQKGLIRFDGVGGDPSTTEVFDTSMIRQHAGFYPIESNGGIAVNNWSFNAVKNTDTYKTLTSEIAFYNTPQADPNQSGKDQILREKRIYELLTKPFDEFFPSEAEAEEAWATTLWARLGFTYQQLGNVTNNLESIFSFTNTPAGFEYNDPISTPNVVKQKGIITHNDFDFTYIPSTNGLGTGNIYASEVAVIPQDYSLDAYNPYVYPDPIVNSKVISGQQANPLHILSNSKPIDADKFPSLNDGNNYLIIESDIVKTNAKDAKSNSATIVGIMSKENASNDTIYSVDPITFTMTEPKLLASIEVKIRNPDGSLVSDEIVGKNCGFIFQVEKAIPVAEIPLQSI